MEKYCAVRQATDYSVIRCMLNACWIPRISDTDRFFPGQKCVLKRALVSRYAYIACLVKCRYNMAISLANSDREADF